jgi:hypothetical protein
VYSFANRCPSSFLLPAFSLGSLQILVKSVVSYAQVKERTDDRLALSFTVDLPDNRFTSAEIAVTYKEDGGTNTTDLTITATTPPQKLTNIPTHILSTPTERIMTPIGGLELKTDIPLPDKFTLKVVHIRSKQDTVEIEAEFADFFLPNAIIQASKKAPEAKK